MADEVKLENGLVSKVDVRAAKFVANKAAMRVLLGAVRAEEEVIRGGGGAKAAAAQRAKGRLTVRERIGLLVDPGTELMELGLGRRMGCMGSMGVLRRQGW